MPTPSDCDISAAALVSLRNNSTSAYSQALDLTVRMFDKASSQTAVARSDWACDRLLNALNAPPSNDITKTANGTATIATVPNFGEMRNNEMPPPGIERKQKKKHSDSMHSAKVLILCNPPINCAVLLNPCDTHCLKHDLKSCTSAVNRFTNSPVRLASKKDKSCITICLNKSCRNFAAICSPIWLSNRM